LSLKTQPGHAERIHPTPKQIDTAYIEVYNAPTNNQLEDSLHKTPYRRSRRHRRWHCGWKRVAQRTDYFVFLSIFPELSLLCSGLTRFARRNRVIRVFESRVFIEN